MKQEIRDLMRSEIALFAEKLRAFDNGELEPKAYKGFSGGFGSYAQRNGGNMLRLRMAGGRLTIPRLGFVVDAAERCGVPLYEYTPSQVKVAVTGYGKAEKRQVMDMTKRLLKLNAIPRPDDAADALAIALCHARSFTSRLPQSKPLKETV